jgi:predicted nucleic acid-binding protein
MALVVDASAIASVLLPHEDGAAFRALLTPRPRLHAPWLIQAEVGNILVVQARRGRISAATVRAGLDLFAGFGLALDTGADLPGVADLAARHGLTFYDALYLDLALRLRLPLATFDAALIRAAQGSGVDLALP